MKTTLLGFAFGMILLTARAQTKADAFLGEWTNVNASKNGITRVVIAKENDRFTVHVWGACPPSECDLGTAPAEAGGSADASAPVSSMFVVLNQGSVERFITLSLLRQSETKLSVQTDEHFTDQNGGPDRHSQEEFQRPEKANVGKSGQGQQANEPSTPGSPPGNLQTENYYEARGAASIHKQDYDQAISDLTEGIQLYPQFALLYNARGSAYWCKGDADPAISDFTKATRLRPDWPVPFRNRSIIYWGQRKDDLSKADFEEAKRLGYKGDFETEMRQFRRP
jgi:hypothetical protein